jgi:hypothetical protein
MGFFNILNRLWYNTIVGSLKNKSSRQPGNRSALGGEESPDTILVLSGLCAVGNAHRCDGDIAEGKVPQRLYYPTPCVGQR